MIEKKMLADSHSETWDGIRNIKLFDSRRSDKSLPIFCASMDSLSLGYSPARCGNRITMPYARYYVIQHDGGFSGGDRLTIQAVLIALGFDIGFSVRPSRANMHYIRRHIENMHPDSQFLALVPKERY